MKKLFKPFLALLATTLLLSGCNFYNLVFPKQTLSATPTSEPITEINICQGYEPRSLYLYQAGSQAEYEILKALYDGPIDVSGSGEKTAVILENVPDFWDGSAVLTPIAVSESDEVVNSYGDLVSLKTGIPVFPSGCTSSSCVVVWDGLSELTVDQISATYTLKDGLKWSDGQPLTASDSRYAFQVASDPVTPVSKRMVDLTESYEVMDDHTIQWTAKPGLITDAFEDFFWPPLPQHAWGEYSADQLLTADDVNRRPLSWGPFMVDEWEPGAFIRLAKNPFYFRADEGLPETDIINFKFISPADTESLLTVAEAECDIVSPTALGFKDITYIAQNAQALDFQLLDLQPHEVELLAFGIIPFSYDDNYYPYGVDRPDIFGDVRTRQAIAYCIDRDTIINKLLGGAVARADSILSADHALLNGISLSTYPYDPAAGISLLQQVGWSDSDFDPQTPFTAVNVYNVPARTAFEVELLISESPLRGEIAAEIASNLAVCGIKANITQIPLNELYQPGPGGRIFGRQFDLALLSWQTGADFNCGLFTTSEIPSDVNYWLGEKTGGANFYGYSNTAYDNACALNMQAGLDAAAADQAAREAIMFLVADLPVIPIYQHPHALLKRRDVCMQNVNRASEFMLGIEQIYKDVSCQ